MKSFKEYIVEAKKTSATAWVILHTGKKIILGKRAPGTNNPNQWNFFGGHVDEGESPKEAAVRELKEETNFKLSPSALREISRIGNVYYFSAKVDGLGKLDTTSEISKVAAYKLTDLPNNLHAKTQDFFDRLDELLG